MLSIRNKMASDKRMSDMLSRCSDLSLILCVSWFNIKLVSFRMWHCKNWMEVCWTEVSWNYILFAAVLPLWIELCATGHEIIICLQCKNCVKRAIVYVYDVMCLPSVDSYKLVSGTWNWIQKLFGFRLMLQRRVFLICFKLVLC